jgi:hypothetical protein
MPATCQPHHPAPVLPPASPPPFSLSAGCGIGEAEPFAAVRDLHHHRGSGPTAWLEGWQRHMQTGGLPQPLAEECPWSSGQQRWAVLHLPQLFGPVATSVHQGWFSGKRAGRCGPGGWGPETTLAAAQQLTCTGDHGARGVGGLVRGVGLPVIRSGQASCIGCEHACLKDCASMMQVPMCMHTAVRAQHTL